MALKKKPTESAPVERRETAEEFYARHQVPPPTDERQAEVARQFGIDPTLRGRALFEAVAKAKRRAEPPHPKAWAWQVLRDVLAGKRDGLAGIHAAEALKLEPKEALRRAAEGWTENGAPKTREAGQDDEERAW